jgi:hypothetical protein
MFQGKLLILHAIILTVILKTIYTVLLSPFYLEVKVSLRNLGDLSGEDLYKIIVYSYYSSPACKKEKYSKLIYILRMVLTSFCFSP